MLTSSMGTGASAYTDDADGDTLSGGGRGETWDSQNRLVGCSFGSSTDSFKYGADGLRRQSTVNGTVDNYAYDAQSMVREMNSALTPQATYLTGLRGPEYRRNDTQTESDGQGHTFGLTRWYVYDGLGSVVGEVDPLGNLTCADEYDVYGAVRGRTGTATTAHGFVGSLGHLSDASTGLIYMRARYYDPSTGRFASEDSAKSGSNWFVYCNDNSINSLDKTGKDPIIVENLLAAADWYDECADRCLGWANDSMDSGFFWLQQAAKTQQAELECQAVGNDAAAQGMRDLTDSALLNAGIAGENAETQVLEAVEFRIEAELCRTEASIEMGM